MRAAVVASTAQGSSLHRNAAGFVYVYQDKSGNYYVKIDGKRLRGTYDDPVHAAEVRVSLDLVDRLSRLFCRQ